MAYEIASDLSPDLYPVAWLVGNWQGAGEVSYPGIGKVSVTQTVSFDHDGGPYLKYQSETKTVQAATESEVSETVWHTESGYFRIAPETPADYPAGSTALEVLIADPSGHVSVYLGFAKEGKVQLVTDLIARTESAANISAAKRLYGNVAGKLLWLWELAAFGNPMQSYLSVELERV